MVTKKKEKGNQQRGNVKAGNLKLNKETVRELTNGEIEKVRGASGEVCQTLKTKAPTVTCSKAGVTC